ncbi:MAG TPA: LPS assembly protein LptD [Candidatus Acidoferrum sp.]|nr:LPS assembly protein LptD [Candidatus Acidoferrum sp.]
MLGYRAYSIDHIVSVNRHSHARKFSALQLLLPVTVLFSALIFDGAASDAAQQARPPIAKGGVAELSADGPQRRQGNLFIADDNVDIHYAGQRLRADHIEYNDQTTEAFARGHVRYDFENQHLEADEAHYNVGTGRGTFINVRGTVKIERRPNPTLLVTDNPLYFEARLVERFGNDLYIIHQAWITVCDPHRPTWQFYAPRARVRLGKTMALVNTNFRLFRVPLIWLPYATAPAGPKIRQSGLLVPVAGNSTSKGFVFGDEFYWAPVSWMDTTVGAELLSRRGSAERAQFRATPWEHTSIRYNYFGVIDRERQGGHEQRFAVQSLLPHNWRFVADVNELSSLTFRLAFADTFGDAINSDIRSSIFLTHNFSGFSLNLASLNDRSFLNTNPQMSVTLRNTPQARFGSVEQRLWRRLPVYFGFDAFAGAVERDDIGFAPSATYLPIETPSFVARTEFAPRVTLPLHFGRWLNATTTAAFRTTYYGASLTPAGAVSTQSVTRNDGEFTLDLRLPTLERFFDPIASGKTKSRRRYKHTIEPRITYRNVTGIDNFLQFIRFDSDATRTNTNELEYGVTQRFWMKPGDDQPQELLSWRLVQKHYFDPTFGGAILNGQRNVFETFESISPFAFALGPRNSSPIVSDFKITPGGLFDTEHLLEYDPQLHKITVIGTLVKVKPYREFFATLAHFRLQADPILQPLSNQVRVLMGYGSETRRGFNVATGISYDITNSALQNQLVQISYNGKCCGIAVEYRRIALGQVRTDNQFRVAFIVANIGTFGNLRHQEKIF